ncbi:MAG: cell wall hydrolase [Lachnospiraceae bacterium]|nr:cell wall hydrolase [Lachnospiraceae bacterium]
MMKKRMNRAVRLALVLCVICLAGIFAAILGGGKANAASKTGKVTEGPLNVRKGYGTDYSVMTDGSGRVQLAKGTKVSILDSKKVSGTTWYKVSFTRNGKEKTGYVSGKYVSAGETTISGATGSATVTEGPLNVRTGYGTSYDVLTVNGSRVQLAAGEKVTTLESKSVSGTTWYKIEFTRDGKTLTGYVSGAYLKVTESSDDSSDDSPSTITGANATVTEGPLNVRTGYGTSYDIMTVNGSRVQLAKGSRVKTVDYKKVSGTTWFKIQFTKNGEKLTGYVSGAFLDLDEEKIDSKKAATGDSTEPSGEKKGTAIKVTEDEYDLLKRIVHAEAGDQSLKGRIMVANVVLNRVASSRFPNTIRAVIYQSGQFSPVRSGRINTVKPDATTIKAVDEALTGADYSNGALFFCMKTSSSVSNFEKYHERCAEEGDHVFFK